MMISNFGGKVILAGAVDKKELEGHLRGFDNGLTIVGYMLQSAKLNAAGCAEAVRSIEAAENIIHTLKTAEEERYRRFYSLE